MRRFIVVFGLLIFIFALSACNNLEELNDDVKPELSGVEDVVLTLGDSFNILNGVTASDNFDGDITSDITYTVTDAVGNVILLDLNVVGVYFINYRVEDNAGNSYSITREVKIEVETSNNPPIIVADGDIVIAPETIFDPLDGVSASDSIDGDISSIISFVISLEGTLVGDYSNLAEGVYQIVYTVENSLGLTSEVTRMLTVTSETISDNIVHVQLDNIEEATVRIEEFFLDALNDSLTAEEVCIKYVGDVPFSVNNVTVEECISRIELVRPPIDSVFVTNVVEVNREGLIGYDAEVFVSGPGISLNEAVEVAFLGYEGSTLNYIHFITDPFPDTGEPNDEELELAETYLSMFYEEFFNIANDPGQFCSDFLVPMSNEGLTLEICEEQLTILRDVYQTFTIFNVERNGEVILPDQSIANIYVAQVTLETSGESFDFSIEFGLFGDPISLFVLGDPFVNINENPNELVFIDLPANEAHVLVDEFYINLYNPIQTGLEFCVAYLNSVPYGPSLEECSDAVEFMRNETNNLQVITVSEAQVEIEVDNVVSGYIASIEFYYNNSLEPEYVEIPFVIIGSLDMPVFLLLDHPLGSNTGRVIGEFISVAIESVLADIEITYDTLFGLITPDDFCTIYMSEALGSLPDFAYCNSDIQYFIHMTESYNILSVTEMLYYFDGELVTAYETGISVVNTQGESYEFFVYSGYIQEVDTVRFLLLSNPFSYIGSDYNTTYASVEEAQAILLGLYEDMLNPTIDVNLICGDYILNDPNGPTLQECIDVVSMMRVDYTVALVQDVLDAVVYTEFEILNGFTATIILDGLNGAVVFNLEFIVVGTDTFDSAVFMGNPMGENAPQESQYADINETEAFNLIYQYYDDAVDASIPANLFCTTFLPLELDMQVMDVEICEAVRTTFMEEAYIFNVSNVVFFLEGIDNPPYFTAEVARSGPAGSIYYDVAFIFLLDEFNNVVPATAMEQALGINAPSPTPEIFNGVPELEALEYLNAFYGDLFGAIFTNVEVCDVYFKDIPIPTPFTYEECLLEIDEVQVLTTEYIINDIFLQVVNEQDHFIANISLNTDLGNMTFDVEFALWGYPNGSEVFLEFVTAPFVLEPLIEVNFPNTVTLSDEQARNEIEIFYQLLNSQSISLEDFCYLFVILNDDYSFMEQIECEGFKTTHNSFDLRTYEVGVITYNLGENGLPPHYIVSVTRTIGAEVKTYDVLFFFFDDYASGFYLATIGTNAIGENDLSSTG